MIVIAKMRFYGLERTISERKNKKMWYMTVSSLSDIQSTEKKPFFLEDPPFGPFHGLFFCGLAFGFSGRSGIREELGPLGQLHRQPSQDGSPESEAEGASAAGRRSPDNQGRLRDSGRSRLWNARSFQPLSIQVQATRIQVDKSVFVQIQHGTSTRFLGYHLIFGLIFHSFSKA